MPLNSPVVINSTISVEEVIRKGILVSPTLVGSSMDIYKTKKILRSLGLLQKSRRRLNLYRPAQKQECDGLWDCSKA